MICLQHHKKMDVDGTLPVQCWPKDQLCELAANVNFQRKGSIPKPTCWVLFFNFIFLKTEIVAVCSNDACPACCLGNLRKCTQEKAFCSYFLCVVLFLYFTFCFAGGTKFAGCIHSDLCSLSDFEQEVGFEVLWQSAPVLGIHGIFSLNLGTCCLCISCADQGDQECISQSSSQLAIKKKKLQRFFVCKYKFWSLHTFFGSVFVLEMSIVKATGVIWFK